MEILLDRESIRLKYPFLYRAGRGFRRLGMCVLTFALIAPLRADTATSGRQADSPSVQLLWQACIPADSTDCSGQHELLSDGTPHNLLGGLSAIEYAGQGDLYWALADRGPKDGATDYRCRIHLLEIKQLALRQVEVTTLVTKFIQLQPGVFLSGWLKHQLEDAKTSVPKAALGRQADGDQPSIVRGLAYDPEGVRVARDGSLLVTDEYGPYVDRFSADLVLLESWTLPDWIRTVSESAIATAKVGAVPNRGLEGLALMPDGQTMVAAFQGPLVQDSHPVGDKRLGDYVRLIKLDVRASGPPVYQFAYPLEDTHFGISEILAVDDHRLLVLERDGKPAGTSKCKAIFLIDTTMATDISTVKSLPAHGPLPAAIKPVGKTLFLDLLDPKHGLNELPGLEKVEGLALGPPLPDGRRQLVICTDNDFDSRRGSYIFGFAINP
ncbi:MAG: esterase-like activity of phytase family protein [Pirellulaceae bacterium]|nr:esterase-like activity of phytase family protein [Pirellulaceae bacterium]